MKSVLIANRGEIACRIIRSCRALGLRSIAVYSEADKSALHVELADSAVAIGPAPARHSYLDAASILRAARTAGADAIHPGYGFLSESAPFARDVEAAGLTWIGPTSDTIAIMGDKGRAREAARAAGVPILPGSGHLDPDAAAALEAAAEAVGYPLLVKASAGGGGIGMRRVEDPARIGELVAGTRAQALRSFGDGAVYLERYVADARHIEIQVFGLGDGRVAAFPERDCSAQRRFQKIVEESPAPLLDPATRRRMQDAAVALAARQRYRGAGTVEFIFDADTRQFFFLEMNTRIQVEHPVTEMVTETDLVALQLRLAAGDALDLPALVEPGEKGYAIEARLYAESPERGFLPRPGRLERFVLPAVTADLRIDCGLREGDSVSPHYDPMIAKITARGNNRKAAVDRLAAALDEVAVDGLQTNRAFLLRLLANPVFRANGVSTSFVGDNLAALIYSGKVAAASRAGA